MKKLENILIKIKNDKIRKIVTDTINANFINGIGLRYLLVDAESTVVFWDIVEQLNEDVAIWQKTSTDYWLLQIASFVDKGCDSEAMSLLKKYIKNYKYKDIEYYFLVADFCYKNGIKSKKIEKTAKVCQYLMENKELFGQIIKNKTVAIVGNGGSELGLCKGNEIDGHDYVIRFNNYQTTGYEVDYGSRTDIWIRGFGGDDLKDYTATNKYVYVGWTGDYRFIRVFNDSVLEILYRDCCINRIPCSFIDCELYYDTIHKTGERLPTTGCSAINTIYEYKKKSNEILHINDIYGFSFLQEESNYAYHYFNDRSDEETVLRTKNHNLSKESEFLRSLFISDNEETTKIKIAVCYHKPINLIKNEIFMPVHVGRDVADKRSKDGQISENDFKWLKANTIGDNTGENISEKNRNYCELTGLYWLWRNQEAYGNPEYIGLFHYRRVLSFDNERNYNPDIRNIEEVVNKYDLIVASEKKAYSPIMQRNIDTIYEHFKIEHGELSIKIFEECLLRECPEMKYAIEKVLHNKVSISWYNIMIARKELFNEYCKWLFNVLQILEAECKDKIQGLEESRLMGFYGEILLAIYVEWIKNYKREVQIGYLEDRKVEGPDLYNFPYLPIGASIKEKIKCYIAKRDKNKNIKNIAIYLKFILRKKIKKNEKVKCIHSLTYRDYFPNGGAGGGGAVLSCQKQLLGDVYDKVELKYSFRTENYYADQTNQMWDVWAAAEFALQKALTEKNTVYITHDYGTAFGLAMSGKKYALISHIQGSRLEEKTNFNEPMTKITKYLIKRCEKIAFKNAQYVCFPSDGAKEHFLSSEYKSKYSFSQGNVLYNTLYANVNENAIDKIPEDHNYLTILSIGQLTTAKGIDRCIDFIDGILKKEPEKWIRWIIVGNGVLKEQIISGCLELKEKYQYFRFSHVNSCTYPQMQYLQRISDLYLMLQRISIFDLSTLEMMSKGKPVILSRTEGNIEFCKENNIWLADEDNYDEIYDKVLYLNLEAEGKINKKVFDKYFSKTNFCMSYKNLIDNMLVTRKKDLRLIDERYEYAKMLHQAKVDIVYEVKGNK